MQKNEKANLKEELNGNLVLYLNIKVKQEEKINNRCCIEFYGWCCIGMDLSISSINSLKTLQFRFYQVISWNNVALNVIVIPKFGSC